MRDLTSISIPTLKFYRKTLAEFHQRILDHLTRASPFNLEGEIPALAQVPYILPHLKKKGLLPLEPKANRMELSQIKQIVGNEILILDHQVKKRTRPQVKQPKFPI